MQAIILAGGKGTRLHPYTITLPKPLVPVGDRPILEIVIGQLKAAGVSQIVMAVNHMADLIMAFFGSGEKLGVNIRYSIEDKPLGTVAPLRLIENLQEHFIVMNGDILTDLDLRALYERHVASGALLTIASYQRTSRIDFGVLDVDAESGLLTGFREKPEYTFNVSMGIYVFSRALLEAIPANRPYGFDQLVLDMLRDGRPVCTFPFSGYWLDIGRPDDYERANQDLPTLPFAKEPTR